MRVARHVAIAVVELDQVAVTLAWPRPSDDTRGHRKHISPGIAREIHALVKSVLAVERIHALAKVRRNIAFAHRTPRGFDLQRQLPAENHILECGKLPE